MGNDYFFYDLSAKLLQHSLEKNPQDMIIEDAEIIEKIKQDDNFKSTIKEIVNKYGKECNSFEITDNDKQGFTFDNSDLYCSSTIYNLAYYSVKFNVIKEFEIKIKIDNYIL